MRRDFYATYFELQRRHWWFAGRRRILIDLLESRLDRDDLAVLDFGCGTGAMLDELARFGPVTGVDAEAEAIAFCRRRGHDRLVHVPAGEPLPFEDGFFDLVTALDVIEHIDDDRAALAELRRVLKPGGAALVAVPAFRFLWGDQDEISHHRRRYTRKQLVARMNAAGLAVEHSSYFNSILFPAIAAIRLARRTYRAPRADRSDLEIGGRRPMPALARLFGSESRAVRSIGLPLGVSVLAFARAA